MNIADIHKQIVYLSSARVGIKRTSLVITLAAMLGLIGSLTMVWTVGADTPPSSNLRQTVINQSTFWHHQPSLMPSSPQSSTPTSTTTISPTPAPATTLTPSPPITPFPTSVRSQIATLQARDRFLYHGNNHLPEIALTFDDGPNPVYTPQILAILQRYGIKATFFCVGQLVTAYPALVQQEFLAGHVIGNHSWSHPDLANLSSSAILKQLTMTSDAIQQATGTRPFFFRPPYGAVSSQTLIHANTLGLTTIIWNDEAEDWLRPGPHTIIRRILSLASDGAIILLHDGGGNRSQTVAALPTIIETLQSRGYRFVTLQQMVNDLHITPVEKQASPSSSPTQDNSQPSPTPTASLPSQNKLKE